MKSFRRPAAHRGLTLIEMLIAMAITLVMMAAVVNLFANISAGVRDRRAMLELGSQLRTAREQLSRDLAGATCPAIPPQDPGENVGYIEIVEGIRNDFEPLHQTLDNVLDTDGDSNNNYVQLGEATLIPSSQLNSRDGRGLGDFDDILALTVRSTGEPFVGRGPGGQRIESDLAEVIWFAVQEYDPSVTTPTPNTPAGEPGMRRIYRRVLLIAPWIDPINPNPSSPGAAESTYTVLADPSSNLQAFQLENAAKFFQRYDISAHWDVDRGVWVPNNLEDLTKRENRYLHAGTVIDPNNATHDLTWPHAWLSNPIPLQDIDSDASTGNNTGNIGASYALGQDLMLNDALAFDVRVYDPGAPLLDAGGSIYQPGEPGWELAYRGGPLVFAAYGAFVDLGWGQSIIGASIYSPPAGAPESDFIDDRQLVQVNQYAPHGVLNGQQWRNATNNSNLAFPATYDTWSSHYEKDGIDQDEDSAIDEGTNGFDDDLANGVDDAGERETVPPYDVPLRGIQVKLRVYEREARQVREATAVRNFVP